MKKSNDHELPDEQLPHLRRAVRLEIVTLIYMITVVVLMGLVMGNSQAMRAAWIEDLLVLIPPIAFLITSRIRKWKPTDEYPFGYHRAVAIGFLASAIALIVFGLFLLYEGVSSLVRQHHPTIGSIKVFGYLVWQGWLMLPVLIYSATGPVILGHLMMKPARKLHDKVLYTTSQMLKADWLTAGAAFLGILGISLGWWWADAVAATVISLDILHDGWRTLRGVIGDLMDRTPQTTEMDKQDPLLERLERRLRALPWVRDVSLRMRESGHVLVGDVLIVPVDEADPIGRTKEVQRVGHDLHWRVNTLTVELVEDLSDAD